jgi:NodT family efflux transporter outer membrane factor (OMF) lipoprotein
MKRLALARLALIAVLLAHLLTIGGCTSLEQFVHNGFKVGPNFHEPATSGVVAEDWIDTDEPNIQRDPIKDDAWWNTFHDPVLNSLIKTAQKQNLDLKSAAARVLQAQAQRNIAAGNLLPQSQNALADYAHVQIGQNLNPFGVPIGLPNTLDVWATGFNASWEIDFWGRLRRSVESSNGDLGASVEGYRDAMVTLLADVATAYVQVRTTQQRLEFARKNVEIQEGTLDLTKARLKQGKATQLDIEQARSNLAQTQASIPPLVISLRQTSNRLCVLLRQSAQDLSAVLGEGKKIPLAAPEVAVGIPADLLQRRPDVRRALREAASQSAQIGVAEADFYPRFAVSGFLGYTADDIRYLFAAQSFTAYVLPSFQWKILNYGRILNNVRLQEARLQEKIWQYQLKVLNAGKEVEDGLIGFIESQVQAESLSEGAEAAQQSVDLVLAQYKAGLVDFNRVFTTQAQLVTQLDQLATAKGNIALNLIAVYRALGGGWQTCDQPEATPALMPPIPME